MSMPFVTAMLSNTYLLDQSEPLAMLRDPKWAC